MSDNSFYLCTNLVLSSDFVQSSLLMSIHIWHNICFHLTLPQNPVYLQI